MKTYDPKFIAELDKKAYEMRLNTLNMCIESGTGHVTSSFSCAEILTGLFYGDVLKYDSKNPDWEDRDRFLLSKGQASPIMYNILLDVGFFEKELLDNFAQPGARLGVHMQSDAPGVEMSAGSLGHGLGIGVGRAIAARKNKQDYFNFVLMGDAECYEGSVWEAAQKAGHDELNNLVAIVDRNWAGVIDFTENAVRLEPFEDKFASCGWYTKRINGHDMEEVLGAFDGIRSRKINQPYAIIADTVKGEGISFMENVPKWHSLAPQGNDAERSVKEVEAKLKEKTQYLEMLEDQE